jgi:hypothetical protein
VTELPADGDRPPPPQPAAAPVRPSRLIIRAEKLLGAPVRAAARFQVEGFLPYYWIGFAVGVAGARLWGGLGAVICLLLAMLVGRLATRGRAPGYPLTTVLAVTDTHVYALRTARSGDRQLGQWPRATVATRIRRKQVTLAITLDQPDGTPVRLELLDYIAQKRPQAFLDSVNRPQQVLAGEPAQREGQEAQLPGPEQTEAMTRRLCRARVEGWSPLEGLYGPGCRRARWQPVTTKAAGRRVAGDFLDRGWADARRSVITQNQSMRPALRAR